MMNCKGARRLLYAFADGELSVKDNCEVLDHLKMCPECARTATEQQALRAAVQSMMSRSSVPAGLLERVRTSIRLDSPTPTPSAVRAAPQSVDRAPRRLARFYLPLAAAASLTLAIFAARQAWNSGGAPASPQRAQTLADLAVNRIVNTHETCAAHFDQHQHPRLPIELAKLPDAVNVLIEQPIHAMAPNFEPGGYTFESANVCAAQQGSPGLHILYAAEGGKSRLSFFSAPRWECLDDGAAYAQLSRRDARDFCVLQQKDHFAIVAWHDHDTTHICCGAMPVDDLISLVKPVRVALAAQHEQYALLWKQLGR
ncbi:MAG: zf-HC2 domain-containing protein [Phycisphaerae bacterium]